MDLPGHGRGRLLSDFFLRDVAVDPKNPNNLYAASSSNETWGWDDSRSQGFLYSRDGGLTWKQANEGLSWPFAATIAVDPNDPSYVFLGSPGLGFQRRRFSDLIRLRLNGPRVQNGTCQLSWNSESGWTYKVLRKTLLTNVWTELAVVPSAGTVTGYSDALSSAGPTFYQVSGLSQ